MFWRYANEFITQLHLKSKAYYGSSGKANNSDDRNEGKPSKCHCKIFEVLESCHPYNSECLTHSDDKVLQDTAWGSIYYEHCSCAGRGIFYRCFYNHISSLCFRPFDFKFDEFSCPAEPFLRIPTEEKEVHVAR